MKYQTLMHWKFRQLHRALGSESIAHTAGYLEVLWLHCQQPDNGPILRKDEVEAICDWQGEPRKLLRCLLEFTWLDECDGGEIVEVHDFADHAPGYVKKRDHMAAYMRKYRKDKKEQAQETQPPLASVNEHKPLQASVNDPTQPNPTQRNSSKTNTSTLSPLLSPRGVGGESPQNEVARDQKPQGDNTLALQVVDHWNAMAKGAGLPPVDDFTSRRRRALRDRLQDPYFAGHWLEAILKIPSCPSLMGDMPSGWKATFDWLLKDDSVAGILEGKYDNKRKSKVQPAISECCMRPEDNPDHPDFNLWGDD